MSQPQPANRGRAVGAGAAVALAASLVIAYEGLIPNGYADPVGIPTACYGHTGPEVRIGARYTLAECKALLAGDLAKANRYVRDCIRVPMTEYQEAALTSATFNAGPAIVCGSTLGRLANQGRWAEACAQLDRWVYAKGIKLRGLVRRRASERLMCEGKA